MSPNELTLTGFVGIKDGLNKDTITLNLRNLPQGLIGITGPTGKGKSTIMDNLHPYRLMPSRCDKKYSPGSFSFFDHLMLGKAEKLLLWTHFDGREFKSLLQFSVKSKKTNCFLYELIDGQWQTFNSTDGLIICNGATEMYDKAIVHLLGTPELFFASRFLAQSRKPLSAYSNSDIKQLISEMLSIEKLRLLSKKSSEVAQLLKCGLEKLQKKSSILLQAKNSLVQLKEDNNFSKSNLEKLKHDKSNLDHQLGSATKFVTDLEASAKEGELEVQKIALIEANLTKHNEKLAFLDNQYSTEESNRTLTLRNITKQINEAKIVLQDESKVEEAITSLSAVNSQFEISQNSLKDIKSKLEIIVEKKNKLDVLKAQHTTTKNNGEHAISTLKTIWLQSSILEEVPCASMDINGRCQLLSTAREANAQVPMLTEKSDNLRQQYASEKTAISEIELQVVGLSDLKNTLNLAETQLKSEEIKLKNLTLLANKKPSIDAAKKSLIDYSLLFEDLSKQMQVSKTNYSHARTSVEEEIAQLKIELSSLKSLDNSLNLLNAKNRVVELKASISAIEGRIESAIRNNARLDVEIENLEKSVSKEAEITNSVTSLSQEIAYWNQLTIGFGNNGLIALCIDDSGPVLCGLVNQLLECYGAQYSIEINTQSETQSGVLKEDFEIIVHDSISATSKKLDYMSGGQKVIINDCLSRGIVLYLGQNESNTCLTLFSDETDGALDLDRKRQFMAMKYKVLELSGCTREYFISHTPDCFDQADAVINLSLL